MPMPASPESSTTWPSPVFALDQRRSSSSNSSSRPTRAVRPVVCSASKRLSTELARSAAQARAGPAMPLRSLAPRSLSSNRLPSSLRVPSAMTTMFGSAIALQARREVRRLADDAALLRLSRSDEVADHDKPGGDADTHLQRSAGRGRELRHRLDQRKPGTHGALGVMLVGLGIAEISQHAVAHVLGDEPAGLGDLLGAATVIGTDDLAHVLGIQPRRQRGRADEVAEHHRELAALGVGPWDGRLDLRRNRSVVQWYRARQRPSIA